jgi:methyl-accepting chemotaxis protein
MSKSAKKKQLFNIAYSLGAVFVILGALFKIQHYTLFGISGGVVLTVGMIIEALVFFMSIFESPEEELDWTLAYPELAGGLKKEREKQQHKGDAQGMLSQKLDDMLKNAKLDSGMIESLKNGMENLGQTLQNVQKATVSMNGIDKYSTQLSTAATQMEALNSLYKLQVESADKQAKANEELAINAIKLKQNMQSLNTNLTSLNDVYGSMLSAMSANK